MSNVYDNNEFLPHMRKWEEVKRFESCWRVASITAVVS